MSQNSVSLYSFFWAGAAAEALKIILFYVVVKALIVSNSLSCIFTSFARAPGTPPPDQSQIFLHFHFSENVTYIFILKLMNNVLQGVICPLTWWLFSHGHPVARSYWLLLCFIVIIIMLNILTKSQTASLLSSSELSQHEPPGLVLGDLARPDDL